MANPSRRNSATNSLLRELQKGTIFRAHTALYRLADVACHLDRTQQIMIPL